MCLIWAMGQVKTKWVRLDYTKTVYKFFQDWTGVEGKNPNMYRQIVIFSNKHNDNSIERRGTDI